MDLSSYAVYGYLALVSIGVAILGKKSVKHKGQDNQIWVRSAITVVIIAVCFAFVSGARYDVGVDWFGYMVSYENLKWSGYDHSIVERWELGYSAINRIYAHYEFRYQWMFFTVALIGWIIYFSAVTVAILPALLFFTLGGEIYFWSNNAVRQFVAAAAFVLSVRYIDKRKISGFLATITFGTLFHLSILVLLPLYWVIPKLKSITHLMPLVFVMTFVLGQLGAYMTILQLFEAQALPILVVLGYEGYIDRVGLILEPELGLGFFFIILTNFIVLAVGSRIRETDTLFRAHLSVFFIGTVVFNLLYASQLVGRIAMYFLLVKPILLAYILVHLRNNLEGVAVKCFLVLGYVAIFLAAIQRSSHQCCPYQWAL
jgi:hypothetical protein